MNPGGPEKKEGERKPTENETVIPVVAEEAHAAVRKTKTGGVRVQKHVREREETIDFPLQKEQVEVRRVAKNERVNGPLAIREEGGTTIIPVVREVLKVEKQWMLVEEYHIVKKRVQEHEQQRVVLREEEAEIQRIGADGEEIGPATVKQRGVEPEPFTERLRARRGK